MSARLNTFRSQSPSIDWPIPIPIVHSQVQVQVPFPFPVPIPRRTCPFGNLIISFLSAAASANHSELTTHSSELGTLGTRNPWPTNTLFQPHSSSSNVSAVFLFSVIVLNQSQKSVIMTALLIVTAHSANCPGPSVGQDGQSASQPVERHTIPCLMI